LGKKINHFKTFKHVKQFQKKKEKKRLLFNKKLTWKCIGSIREEIMLSFSNYQVPTNLTKTNQIEMQLGRGEKVWNEVAKSRRFCC
jgi:hypothetical protein